MSAQRDQQNSSALEASDNEDADVETLQMQLERLAEENQRLRSEYAHAKRVQYRRSAIGLALVGLLAGGGALLFPSTRTVLTALAGTGLFAALLVYYLTPEQFVPLSVGERIYRTLATNQSALVAELGLQDDRIYIPLGQADDEVRAVKLFVPQHPVSELPDSTKLERPFVIDDETSPRGLAVQPVGESLYEEFITASATDVPDEPVVLVEQLAEAIVEVFNLAGTATPEFDPTGKRCSIAITGSAIGRPDRFDHPVGSLFATGLARTTGNPVWLEIEETADRVDYVITCRWDHNETKT